MTLNIDNSLFATHKYQHTISYVQTYSVFKEDTDNEIKHNTYSMFDVFIYTGGRPVVT